MDRVTKQKINPYCTFIGFSMQKMYFLISKLFQLNAYFHILTKPILGMFVPIWFLLVIPTIVTKI